MELKVRKFTGRTRKWENGTISEMTDAMKNMKVGECIPGGNTACAVVSIVNRWQDEKRFGFRTGVDGKKYLVRLA